MQCNQEWDDTIHWHQINTMSGFRPPPESEMYESEAEETRAEAIQHTSNETEGEEP